MVINHHLSLKMKMKMIILQRKLWRRRHRKLHLGGMSVLPSALPSLDSTMHHAAILLPRALLGRGCRYLRSLTSETLHQLLRFPAHWPDSIKRRRGEGATALAAECEFSVCSSLSTLTARITHWPDWIKVRVGGIDRRHRQVNVFALLCCFSFSAISFHFARVSCILCDFCSWSGVQYECACHGHFPLWRALWPTFALALCTKCINFWRTVALCVFNVCRSLFAAFIGNQALTKQPFQRSCLFIFLFWEAAAWNQKYVSAPSSVKANWQAGQNYGFTYSNKNISICVHNCYFQCIHIISFSQYMVGFEGYRQKASTESPVVWPPDQPET